MCSEFEPDSAIIMDFIAILYTGKWTNARSRLNFVENLYTGRQSAKAKDSRIF